MPAPTLFFVRHGETEWNAEGRLQGQQDVPLNALGRAQAAEAGARLRAIAPGFAGLDFVSSPLSRARETMELLRASLGLDPEAYRLDPRWKELTFGEWEGDTWRVVRRRAPDLARARERDKWGAVPPGGESYAMLRDRILAPLRELERDTVLVSHGGVARALLVELAGRSPLEAPNAEIVQGRVLVFSGGTATWH